MDDGGRGSNARQLSEEQYTGSVGASEQGQRKGNATTLATVKAL